jgi:hypothetical protein
MTRTIRLEIAGATATHCGSCKWLVPAVDFDNECGRDPWCVASVFDISNCLEGHATPERHHECIEAEAEQAAMERDAAKWRRIKAECGEYAPVCIEGDAYQIAHDCGYTYAADILRAIAAELRGERE